MSVKVTDHDLGHGWIARQFDNGERSSYSIMSDALGERIDLNPESVDRLKSILNYAAIDALNV